MSSVTPSGTGATAEAKGRTGVTKQQKYGYPGQKAKQAAQRRKRRIAELRGQIERCESLIRTMMLMRNQAEAELAELQETP